MSLTIGGVRYDAPSSYEVKREPDYGCDFSSLRKEPTEISVECSVPVESMGDFAMLLPREPAGASHATLVRRVHYGGRKGRSALRRLFAKALPIEMTTEFLRFEGSAVLLDETEMRVRLHSVGFKRERGEKR